MSGNLSSLAPETRMPDGRTDHFDWKPLPQVETFYAGILESFLAECPAARALSLRMAQETGTRFRDWIDHVELPGRAIDGGRLEELGFLYGSQSQHAKIIHPGGLFPPLKQAPDDQVRLAIRVDSVVDFLAAGGLRPEIRGEPYSHYRQAVICDCTGHQLLAVERRGYNRFDTAAPLPGGIAAGLRAREAFLLRPRRHAQPGAGFDSLSRLYARAAEAAGGDLAAEFFFETERLYWQSRNRAAQIQYARQQRLGLGWANHDHHTYRSSRVHFAPLIRLFEQMGFYCRERFYAGREAGWGAQVLEHPVTGIVIFADVDLSPDELSGDFAHAGLEDRRELGTIGLWCALHGESIFEAGMHHLECTFDFDLLRRQLAEEGVEMMKPFSDFPHLRQAFTAGEIWPVSHERIGALLDRKQISEADAERFRREGALGSHLENLQRGDGFKGFNQQGVNEIISGTDPRLAGPGGEMQPASLS